MHIYVDICKEMGKAHCRNNENIPVPNVDKTCTHTYKHMICTRIRGRASRCGNFVHTIGYMYVYYTDIISPGAGGLEN